MTFNEQLAEIIRLLKEVHEEFEELEDKLAEREEQYESVY